MKLDDFAFLQTWRAGADALLSAMFYPFVVAAIFGLGGNRVAVRILAASVLSGALVGYAAEAMGQGPGLSIFLGCATTATAPKTIMKISGWDVWELIDRIRSSGPPPPPPPDRDDTQ